MKPAANKMILVIPYGNPLRGDDAVGWRVAEKLNSKDLDENCRISPVHQLTPEIAEEISHSHAAIFVDASAEGKPGNIDCRELEPSDETDAFTYHSLTPSRLLALSDNLYGQQPKAAYLVTLTGENFSFGDDLSSTCAGELPKFTQKVRKLIVKHKA